MISEFFTRPKHDFTRLGRVDGWLGRTLLKFGLDIQSQTEVIVRKPKNPRWLPGGHFESDIAENK